jgi:hypothetical protein
MRFNLNHLTRLSAEKILLNSVAVKASRHIASHILNLGSIQYGGEWFSSRTNFITPGTLWIIGCVDVRYALEAVSKRKVCCPFVESISNFSVDQPLA